MHYVNLFRVALNYILFTTRIYNTYRDTKNRNDLAEYFTRRQIITHILA